MKSVQLILFLLVLNCAPGFTQVIPPSSEKNAVVYFLRSSDSQKFDPTMLYLSSNPSIYDLQNNVAIPSSSVLYTGANSNDLKFILFDSSAVIGRLDTISYMRYECKAGHHLFWSSGKTNDFVEADLAAGKVYFIHMSGKLRERGPDLKPINPENMFWVEGILRFIDSKSADSLPYSKIQWLQKKHRKKIKKGFMRYEDAKCKGYLPCKLTADMYYRPLNFRIENFETIDTED